MSELQDRMTFLVLDAARCMTGAVVYPLTIAVNGRV
jgi:hypothetical protein